MAVLAEGPQVIRDVWPVGEDMVHLIGGVAAEYAEAAIAFENCAPDLVPVFGEFLTAP